MSNSKPEPLECLGDIVKTEAKSKPNKRSHGAVEIEKTEFEGEEWWTCPECGWLLKEFMGVHVSDG